MTMKFNENLSDEEFLNAIQETITDAAKVNELANAKIWQNISYCGKMLLENIPSS